MGFAFPQGFLLGTATAAHQVEGGNTSSDYWLYENLPGSEFREPSGDACDHLSRYREDIALLADIGFSSLRFSIEWARVEPEEGVFDQAALDHYRTVLETCHAHGMTPIVTLHHFTSPRWLIAEGGWESRRTPDRFARYAARVTESLGDLFDTVCTINEANTGCLTAATSIFGSLKQRRKAEWVAAAAAELGISPGKFAPWNFGCSKRAVDTILRSHHKAVAAIKNIRPELQVGITLAMQDIQAAPGGEEAARKLRYDVEDRFLQELTNDDFVGVQTYTRWRVGPNGVLPPEPGIELTQLGYEFWPEALEPTIRHAADVAGIPVIVTENGLGTEDDTRRVAYVERALAGVRNCLEDGVDLRGYFCWSGFDNYEWEFGFGPKFGLVAIDRATQERLPKPSAYWFGDIARAHKTRELAQSSEYMESEVMESVA